MISETKDLWAHWIPPKPTDSSFRTGLKIANTLKGGELVEFIPHQGKLVK
jgi:cysteinyl-tRNA synthetase